MTRVQKERLAHQNDYQESISYRLTQNIVENMKPNAIIMHPLPRVHELPPEVDASPKAVYFKQTYYGLLIRMALLTYLLK